MKLKVLGCSGGIGGENLHTTSLLLDDDILIDAGTGVTRLDLSQLARIDHVFLTHSHLDHIACLPFISDSAGELRDKPLIVYATAETRSILEAHIFNWLIWPDFTVIPTPEQPFIRFQTVQLGETVRLGDRKITVLPAVHTVPAVGYQIDSGAASLVFTGDTTTNDALWGELNQIINLRYLIIETAFSNRDIDLAKLSMHLCPLILAQELGKLNGNAEIFVTHFKPAQIDVTARELEQCGSRFAIQALHPEQVFDF
ncbi:MAG: beta-lactamase domain protein [Herminiimonas sp.]|nr:beta-lactamase domain protein [Herminiimonas sp.]MDB5852318.1 beta-lactamase domain protein [Herminiimonas sp.]